MTENEFRFQQFDKLCEKLEDKRIVLYGTGINAKGIIDKYPQLQIIGIMEKQPTCPYIYGKKNLRIEEIVSLRIDVIVIASRIEPLKEIYERICSFCHSNNIQIFDMYGNDLFQLFFELAENQRTLCDRNEDVLRKAIEQYDIISIDLFETLLNARRGIEEKIWYLVAEENKNIILNPIEFIAARKQAGEKAKDKNQAHSLHAVYAELGTLMEINDEQKQALMKSEKEFIARDLILSRKFNSVLNYAKEIGKEVYLISDFYFSKMEIEKILRRFGVEAYDDILSSANTGFTKASGLFRIIDRKNRKWIHIGENEITDGVCPLINKIDIFLVQRAEQLAQDSPYREIFQNINTWYREGKVNEVVKYGSGTLYELIMRMELLDPFIYCKSEVKGGNNRKLSYLDVLKFEEYEEPEVSIIIPVYNQFLFTYNCLYSILKNTAGISYEVIIADDCSTDMTVNIEKVVTGITVLHNKRNLRFLKNCNNAAKKARGKYILFLNNDTFVQPQWLSKLISLIKKADDIGMVGSKLIYPDGRLQEAGGIVWKDASAWNFGYKQVAGAPVYNYVKEADYISGAAIMIRAELWNEIGGFDKRFAPAYYEDTDLAFEVRKRGYKVLYHPFSVVVHFEGISNGTDVNEGLKSFQVANRDKFYSKWRKVLNKEHFENGTNLFVAKDRSRSKKHILVVDHYVPQHDHDAGGRCTYMYLKAFLNMGMQVTFIGDNFAYMMPYSQELLEMGIEILYGSEYKLHIQEWMEENLKYFDYIYLQRPHISIKYIDIVKKWGRAKIFYFAHDLHHIRLKRQFDLTGDKIALDESLKWKQVEMELFDKADVGHVVGSFEQQYMHEIYPDKPIRNIPLYIFEDIYRKPQIPFCERKDILYVGGFGHPPNIDAVLWFAKEVFPEILKKYPDMIWHIVGNKPTEEIIALESRNIVIEGFVSDDKLEKLYNTCRLAVVPLRVGAGVKGKIIEAAYYQTPIVTTGVGAEGISSEEEALVVANEAREMADKICSLYENYEELKCQAQRENKLIENHYLLKNAIEVLKLDMEI